jgi:hypothetical protein
LGIDLFNQRPPNPWLHPARYDWPDLAQSQGGQHWIATPATKGLWHVSMKVIRYAASLADETEPALSFRQYLFLNNIPYLLLRHVIGERNDTSTGNV